MSEEKGSKENTLKVLERSTKRVSFLKRITHIKLDFNGTIIVKTIEHYAKPIDALGVVLSYLRFTHFEIKVGDKEIKKWKFPFQSEEKVLVSALKEAFGKLKEEKGVLIR